MNPNYNKWFLTKVKQAIKDYNMIQPEDRVLVGLSGGKDSLFLLFVLSELQKFSHLKFHLGAVHLHSGPESSLDSLTQFCARLGIALTIETSDIPEIVFSRRLEKNPCSLCTKLRRGALVNAAKHLGFNKIALGHHGDDAVETLLMNSTLGGKLESFSPVIYYPDNDVSVIRPLIYLREKTIYSVARLENMPVQADPCPIDKKTKRQEMKILLSEMEKQVPGAGDSLIIALKDRWLAGL